VSILDEGGDIQDIVLKKCPYYMVDWPGTDPLALFEVGLLEEDEQSYAVSYADGNADESSTSVQLGGEDSVLVVDESPNKLCISNQSNNLTAATPNEWKHLIALKSRAIWKNRITEIIMGSVIEAIKKQGAAKNIWKKEKLEAIKAWKQKNLHCRRINW
jgi:hypothetical protein